MRPAVLLDRDGTIIEDAGYLEALDQVRLFPWTIDALRLVRRAGFALVVVTNQSGVARGYFPESRVHEVHAHLDGLLARGGARIDGYYHCPHFPALSDSPFAIDCDCRKPKPGLALRAARDLDLDLSRSFVVGDKWTDIGLARAVGATGVLVEAGNTAAADAPPSGLIADAIVTNLIEAASWIISHGYISRGATDRI